MSKYADIPSLKCLQVFEQIARAGNVLRAAETLGITASAASHQLAKLEKSLGCQLFERNAAGVKLNAKGEAYLAMIGVHLQGLMQASEEMKDSDKVNRIRIHSSPTFGYMWLLPRLESFQNQCPGIEVTLACSYEEVDFSRGEVDLAIRHGLPAWEGCEITTVRGEHIMPMASPDYLARAPVKSSRDLMTRRLIFSESTLLRWPEWFRIHHLDQPAQPWLFRFDRSYMSIEAAAMGHGIVLESALLAGKFLEKGKLVQVLPDSFRHTVNAHHIVTPVGFRNRPVIQQFLSWVEMSLTGEISIHNTEQAR